MSVASFFLVGDKAGYAYLILIGIMLTGALFFKHDEELHKYGKFWIFYYGIGLILIQWLQLIAYREIGEYGELPLWIDGVINSLFDLTALAVFGYLAKIHYFTNRIRIWITSTFFALNILAHFATTWLDKDQLPGLPAVYDNYLYGSFFVVLMATIAWRPRHGVEYGSSDLHHLSNSGSRVMVKNK